MSVLSRLKLIVPTALTAGLAACGESVSAPTSARSPQRPSAAVFVNKLDTTAAQTVAEITVTPEGGWFQLGRNAVYFPRNAICDPAKSTYGPAEWEKPCVTITQPITIHARMNNSGESWIHFSPDLRFRPVAEEKDVLKSDGSLDTVRVKAVYLFLYTENARLHGGKKTQREFQFLWQPQPGATGIDESLSDKSLKVRVNRKNGLVYRRVKHFSGYQVALGRSSEAEETY